MAQKKSGTWGRSLNIPLLRDRGIRSQIWVIDGTEILAIMRHTVIVLEVRVATAFLTVARDTQLAT